MCLDTFSYLLGKKKGGGGTPTLQTKSVTITENGSSSVTPDTGYDGLSQVNITANVSGGAGGYDWSAIGYTEEPKVEGYYFNKAKEIYDNWDTSVTDASQMFQNAYISYFPNVDTSNITNMDYMFRESTISEIKSIDMSSCLSASSVFASCVNLRYVGDILPAHNPNMNSMFSGCKNLKEVNKIIVTDNNNNNYVFYLIDNLTINELIVKGPSGKQIFTNCTNLDLKKITNGNAHIKRNNAIISGCTLTNGTVDEFLKYFKTLTGQVTKTLKAMGFTQANADQAVLSSYWQDLVDAGWTTGY